MSKKSILLLPLCLLFMASLVGCGDKGNEETVSSISDSGSDYASEAASANIASEDLSESAQSSLLSSGTDTQIPKEHYEEFSEVNFFVPEGFVDHELPTYNIWSKSQDNDTSYLVYLTDGMYYQTAENSDYTLEDIPGILEKYCIKAVAQAIDVNESEIQNSVSSEETVDVKGVSFIKRTGVMNVEESGEENSYDLMYVAYFTVYDESYLKKIPTTFLVFSDSNSDEELLNISNNVAEKTEWVTE